MGRPENRTSLESRREEEEIDWDAPPQYELHLSGNDGHINTSVLDNGRISMHFNGDTKLFLEQSLPPLPEYEPPSIPIAQSFATQSRSFPLLNIVIQIVGSRGDVQPFVTLGQELQAVGHRIRIATHDVFDDFVTKSGLEFFPIGGDPADLLAYMVKNPGIIPKMETVRAGDIGRKRKMVKEMLEGCWRSCIEPDPKTKIPFVAEAIIANPPSFAHVHCAQALGIPVHLMFTMPWTATRAFPHPLANIQPSNADPKMSNFLSYDRPPGMVDMMTWQGLGSIINSWRKTTLDLEAAPALFDSNLIQTGKVPFTYCWSPALIPKPVDWPSTIDVCGFFFRAAPEYTPTPEIDDFIKAGSVPIYIGFGSIVMEDANAMTETILTAVRECGVRAIVSKGWSKLGTGFEDENVLFIDDCPDEWLFQQVSAVIHHGSAVTTACGLLNGRPTCIVPFFGDQPFWGNMVSVAGAGPPPIDAKNMNPEILSSIIRFLLSPEALTAAGRIAEKMRTENGVKTAVDSFHRHLSVKDMSCSMLPDSPATWSLKTKKGKDKIVLRLSHRAASVLVEEKKIDVKDLRLYKSKPIYSESQRWDPVTATTSAAFDSVMNVGSSIGNLVSEPRAEYRRARSDLSRMGSPATSLHLTSSSQASLPTQNGSSVAITKYKSPSEKGASANGETRSVGGDSVETEAEQNPHARRAAGKALGRGFGKLGNALVRTVVDVPVAFADGLHAAPKLYGGKVRDHGPITGWKSGAVKGGKAFAYGFYDGYVGFFTEPVKGAKENGAKGFVSGFGKGFGGLFLQPHYAIVGAMAYPALGLYKSLNTSAVDGIQGVILHSQKDYGAFFAERHHATKEEVARIVKKFQEFMGITRPEDVARTQDALNFLPRDLGGIESRYPQESMSQARTQSQHQELDANPMRGSQFHPAELDSPVSPPATTAIRGELNGLNEYPIENWRSLVQTNHPPSPSVRSDRWQAPPPSNYSESVYSNSIRRKPISNDHSNTWHPPSSSRYSGSFYTNNTKISTQFAHYNEPSPAYEPSAGTISELGGTEISEMSAPTNLYSTSTLQPRSISQTMPPVYIVGNTPLVSPLTPAISEDSTLTERESRELAAAMQESLETRDEVTIALQESIESEKAISEMEARDLQAAMEVSMADMASPRTSFST